MSDDDINDFVPSLLNPRTNKKNFNLTQFSIASRCSLSLKRNEKTLKKSFEKIFSNKENLININNSVQKRDFPNSQQKHKNCQGSKSIEEISLSAIADLNEINNNPISHSFITNCLESSQNNNIHENKNNISESTEINENFLLDLDSEKTSIYDITERPLISVSFGVTECDNIDLSTKNVDIKKVSISCNNNNMNLDCEVVENSELSIENELEEKSKEPILHGAVKRSSVVVNLEIKKQKLSTEDDSENSRVLILNTDAIEKLSHVIVQPPNFKLVRRKILDNSKFKSSDKRKSVLPSICKNGRISRDSLKQKTIDAYFSKDSNILKLKIPNNKCSFNGGKVVQNEAQEMSKNSGLTDTAKSERFGRTPKVAKKDNESPRSAGISTLRRGQESLRHQDIKTSSSDAPRVPSSKGRRDSISSHSPRKNVDSIQFSLPSKSNKTSFISRNIPNHKIVAGTHFAVDAFSYGDIPSVKHYFLTHFHSDHYAGLKKTFNKILICSKITADLCISRLGVSPKYIQLINIDETMKVEGVEVTAVDANHCPGAIMLVFTLPNGKTILHTGDFRASPAMESYPVFWNKDIHTVYLDTTYCNPRYDFPTQDESLEMALYLLRQKKLNLENAGKKFSSVLIVCGTYTIGKEKFFLGVSRRVGCSVWACPEKDRVLQAIEGRSFGQTPPQACQLHVVPMRDLTYEKLRSYLESLQGAFSEVVAFKPSGWENGKNSSVEKDVVTIHGIPYSEHSSFSEMIRFIKYLKPKQVVPTVDITGGVKAVQKYFPCPLVYKEDDQSQSRLTDYFSIQGRQHVPAVT